MRCVHCNGEDTKVIETRQAGKDLRRRRECTECSQRFTTYERVERHPVRVVKSDQSREFFDREKVKRGILRACEKRPVTQDQIDQVISEIEQSIYQTGEPEVKSKLIGDLVMEKLSALDEVAYIRFASVYKKFKDVKGFTKEIKVLAKRN